MEPTHASWTDERLDDLQRSVEAGFTRVDEDLRALRSDLSGVQRMMVQLMGGMMLTMVTVLATLVSVFLTRG